jgi:hypothetical protein
LRRASYELGEDGKFTEEVAKVFGVPFEVIPFKADKQGPPVDPPKRHHVHAIPSKQHFEIRYPRVEGYTQAIRNRITVDFKSVAPLVLDPMRIRTIQTRLDQISSAGGTCRVWAAGDVDFLDGKRKKGIAAAHSMNLKVPAEALAASRGAPQPGQSRTSEGSIGRSGSSGTRAKP